MEKTINTILVIHPDGHSLGNLAVEEAEKIADQLGLDLVEVRPNVFKILDAGKLAYEASKRKQVKAKPVKEMKFKLNIGMNDYLTKMRQVIDFLESGHSVRITIWFSGREVSRPESGIALMKKIEELIGDRGTVSINPELQGKNMYMTITPGTKK